ncbi:MAG: hypothetical protein KJO07_08055, partial [Deltaproteobacteria bacterium]|nr:hypothetical protein [Deltaproteobacteria bacterium]
MNDLTVGGGRFSVLGSRFSVIGDRWTVIGGRRAVIGSRSSLLGLVLLFAACGSNSEDPELPDIERPAETSGSFYDSVVIGLEYDADFGSGVTDDSGFFDIELGQTVTLSIGAVELGDVSASAIMTPLGLVADSDAMAASVVNRVRFLLALDVDGDPTTGIQIAPALRELADVWSVDFEVSTDDFAG